MLLHPLLTIVPTSSEEIEHSCANRVMSVIAVGPYTPSTPAYRTTARISIRPEAPMPFPSEEEVDRLLALPPLPPSPLISLSPPSVEERLACPNHVRAPLGFRAAMGRLRASSPSTHHPLHPSPPLPPLPSSLHLHHMYTQHYIYLPITILPLPPNLPASLLIPPPVDYREDTPEAAVPPRKRLCLTALTSRYEVGESSTAAPRPTRGHGIDYRFIDTLDAETRHQKAEKVSYGIRDVWVDPTEAVEEVAPTTLKGVNARVTELTAVQEQDTQDVYAVIEDTQDRQTYEAWAHFVELSSAVHYELQAYRTHTQMQDFRQIQEFQARGQTHADDREGVASTAVGLVFSFLVSDNHVAGTTGAIVQEHRLRCTMPNARDVDHHDTAIYIPFYHRTGGFTGNERDIYQSLVYRLFHEGRIMLPDFLEDEPNLRPTSGAHENFAQILRIPFEGVCLYSHEWSISSLQRILDPHPNLYPHPIEDPSLVRDALFKERPEPILQKIKDTVMSSDSASSEPDSLEVALASPDYVLGLEEPDQAPPSPNYMPGPEYPEYLAPSDKEVPVEDQPYAVADSPVALSPGYIADSDPVEDSKDGPVDYPADGGDDDNDYSSNDDKEEEASKEEEEHLAPADSVVAPVVDHVSSSEEIEPFETDESAATPPSPSAYRTTARISIRPEAPMPFPSEEEVERLLALPLPPPSPLISLSPPSVEERLARCLVAPALPSSPLPIVPHLYGSPNHVREPLGFRAVMGRLRASSPSTHHPLHPSSPLPPPPSTTTFYHKEDIPEVELPPRKRLCLTALTSRYKVGESSTTTLRPTGGHGIDYGFISNLDAKTRRQRAEEVGYRIRDVWVDPTEAIEEDRQTQLFQRVDGLVEDRHFHYETARLLDQEALIQDFRIASQESLMTTLIAHVSSLQGQLSTALGLIQALQARCQTHADDHEGAEQYAATATARAAAAAATLMTVAAVKQLIEARVSVVLANHETLRNSTNGQGDKSHNSDTRIRGTMELVFHISNCAVENQVKFLRNSLTWLNSHMKTVTQDVAYVMDWKALKKMMTV
ncbi:hypothetical protein Tco_1403455, partial [Tanacetum coccineum]